MPKKNTKSTQHVKSLTECIGGAFYDLFHPSSHSKLVDYSYLSDLIDFKEFNFIDLKQLHLVKKSDLNLVDSKFLSGLIDIPVVVSFAKYASVFILTFAFMLSVFSGYVKALDYAVSQIDVYASNYYYEKQIANRNLYLAYMNNLETNNPSKVNNKVSSSKVVVEGDMFVVSSDETEVEIANISNNKEDKHLTVVRSVPQQNEYEVGQVAGAQDANSMVADGTPFQVVRDNENISMNENLVSSDIAKGTAFQVVSENFVEETTNSNSFNSLPIASENVKLVDETVTSQSEELNTDVMAKSDERIFRVYELNEDPKEMVYEKEKLTAVNVSKVSTEPVCSFTYGNRKLASGANLKLNPEKALQLSVDYRKDAKLSNALVGNQVLSGAEKVDFIDLKGTSKGSEIEVQVMDVNNQFIGSCKLTVSEGTLASL